MTFSCLAGNRSIEVLMNKATDLIVKIEPYKIRLDIVFLKVQPNSKFVFSLLFIVTKHISWINFIITVKSPFSAATSRGF